MLIFFSELNQKHLFKKKFTLKKKFGHFLDFSPMCGPRRCQAILKRFCSKVCWNNRSLIWLRDSINCTRDPRNYCDLLTVAFCIVIFSFHLTSLFLIISFRKSYFSSCLFLFRILQEPQVYEPKTVAQIEHQYCVIIKLET